MSQEENQGVQLVEEEAEHVGLESLDGRLELHCDHLTRHGQLKAKDLKLGTQKIQDSGEWE